MSASKIISNKAYSLRKSTLSTAEIQKLRKNLTVTPLGHPNYPDPQSFPTYEIGDNWIRIPRGYGVAEYGEPDLFALKEHPVENPNAFEFNGTLREHQEKPHVVVLDHLRKKHIGVLCLQTGSGKSITCLHLLSYLKQRTCILIHKSTLLQQWKEEIHKFLPNARVAIIQQTRKNFSEDFDIYLMMIQTLINIPSVPGIFGLTVIDEVHHAPAETFSKIFYKVNSKYMLGLSATPNRKDGLTKVLHWHMGPMIYEEKPDRRDQQTTEIHICRYDHPTLHLNPRENYSAMITDIGNHKMRSQFVKNAVLNMLKNDPQKLRRVVVFTERRNHASHLWNEFEKENTGRTIGLALGSMKKELLDRELKKEVIIATYQSISEGVSIEQLNCIVFASPKKDITQALGRIFRKIHKDIHPLIIDICDTALKGQEYSRMKIYKQELNDNIHTIIFDKELNKIKEIGTRKKEQKNEKAIIIDWNSD